MDAVFATWLHCLPPIAALAGVAWVLCTWQRNVGLLDVFWPGFFLAAGATCLWRSQAWSMASLALAAVIVAWAIRLSAHLTARNWNAAEDRRYAAMRARHAPGFAWKSLYLVFGLQAVLAWIIAAPLAAGLDVEALGASADAPAGAGAVLWAFGLVLAIAGIAIETLADAQLAAFRARDWDDDAVLETGLWRYSRHPNYFGECCFWWGVCAMAIRPGCWWIVVSPLLMTYLLLRVSGVPMLERDIALRRPAYRAYIARTPAFFPRAPRAKAGEVVP